MKTFFIVFSVLALCAVLDAKPFLMGHFGSKGSLSMSAAPAPAPAPAQSQKSSHGGLGDLLAIPISIKRKIIEKKRAKLNNAFDMIEKVLGSFGGSGSGSGSGSIGGSGSGSIDSGFGGSESGSSSFGGESSYSAGNSGSFGGNSGSFGEAGSVQSYHPQPAPQQNYNQQPIILHLYEIERPQQSQSNSFASANSQVQESHHQQDNFQPEPVHYQPAPAVHQPEPVHYQPAPAVHQPEPVHYQPEPVHYQPAPVVHQPEPVHYQPAPVQQPQDSYGPPSYQPPAPITQVESQAQVMVQIQPENSYLPPVSNNHIGCQDSSHFH